jgi:hypothetical protein
MIIDEFTLVWLAIEVAGGIRSARHRGAHAAHERPRRAALSALGQRPVFVSRAILRSLQTAAIEAAFIDPARRGRTEQTNPSTGVPRSAVVVAVVSRIASNPRHHRSVASPRQRRPAAFESRLLTPAAFKAKHLLNMPRAPLSEQTTSCRFETWGSNGWTT